MPVVRILDIVRHWLSRVWLTRGVTARSLAVCERFITVCLAVALMSVLVGCRSGRSAAPANEAEKVSAPTPVSTSTGLPSQVVTASPAAPIGVDIGSSHNGQPLAARVNGQPIFLEDFQKQVAQTERALVDQGLILEGEEGEAQLFQIRRNVLNGLIEQVVIEQAAAAAGISISEDELESLVQESIALGQGREAFEQWLAENDMSIEEFRETQRSQLLASKMIQFVTVSVPTSAEQVHARHILLSDLGQAQARLSELKGGANFAALAQQNSVDASTAANGGDLGWFPRDVPLVPPLVVNAAFALQPGEISEVIESDQGFHIIKVEAREANRPLTPEMLLFVQQRAFERWLAQQKENTIIEQYIDM